MIITMLVLWESHRAAHEVVKSSCVRRSSVLDHGLVHGVTHQVLERVVRVVDLVVKPGLSRIVLMMLCVLRVAVHWNSTHV